MPELRPVDYLLIGHVAVDLTPAGKQLGGTVSYSALTAQAMGLRVGIVTSAGDDAPLHLLDGIQICNLPTEQSTIFENVKTEHGRKQTLHHRATPISFEQVPPLWRNAPIVHLAPIAQEVDAAMAEAILFFVGGSNTTGLDARLGRKRFGVRSGLGKQRTGSRSGGRRGDES
jgi:hypothetical protein